MKNELLECIIEVSRDEIIPQIKDAKFILVMADDKKDISEQMQQVIVFRHELHVKIFKIFWD